jgi:hypothetical protein
MFAGASRYLANVSTLLILTSIGFGVSCIQRVKVIGVSHGKALCLLTWWQALPRCHVIRWRLATATSEFMIHWPDTVDDSTQWPRTSLSSARSLRSHTAPESVLNFVLTACGGLLMEQRYNRQTLAICDCRQILLPSRPKLPNLFIVFVIYCQWKIPIKQSADSRSAAR